MPPPHPLPDPRTLLTALVNALPPPQPANTTATSNPLATLPQSSKNLLLTLHVLFPHELLPALDLLDRHLVTRLRIHTRASRSDVSAAAGSKTTTNTSTSTAPAPRATSPSEQRSSTDAAPSIVHTASQDANASPNSHVSGLIRTAGAPAQDAETAGDSGVEGVAGEDAAPRPRGAVPRSPELACGSAPVDAGPYVYYVRSAQRRTSRYGTSIDATSSYEVRLRAWNCSCPAFAFAAFPASVVGTEGEAGAALDEGEQGRDTGAGWKFGGVGLGGGTPPVCKHLLACVLGEWCELFKGFVEERDVSVEEAAGWAAGWGD
ncbi:uncharacterized protein K441DRAFT_691607 [Cenococcum geophilum 1.58]|uniref:Uncharacterized protein n=1 Tax=Cenococcum geophilum 1.58 TaxID=794803 RepID=A0ACC8EK22_9PEZI|nr:hypothetical protein K441DRAFT_691607 [Cenococcum geophilum 1.58]